MSTTDTTVATDVWSQIDPEWVDMTIGPFRCQCGESVGGLDVYDEAPQTCAGCGRTYTLAVKVWRTEISVHPAAASEGM